MNMLKRIYRSLGWHLYWNVAQYLPRSFKRGGKFAKWFRAWCCRGFLMHVGTNVNIECDVYFGGDSVSIGDNSGIGIRCQIYGPLTMGDHVMMGPDCDIHGTNHKFDRLDIPMDQQGFGETRGVVVGDDVWIGSRVTIMPGVKIGSGCIIGACSVVTKDIPDYGVAVGNPAVVKKFRK